MNLTNFEGHLLAAHPRQPETTLRKGVILMIRHDESGAVGLQINKQFQDNTFTLLTVMKNVGLYIEIDQPLYYGGEGANNRIHVIHSLDWYTGSTVKVNQEIGVSNDISVLSAISENEGPEYFRVVAGYTKWGKGKLESEMAGKEPYTAINSWNFVPATIESVFEFDDIDQWHKVNDDSTRFQISSWF